MFRLQTMNIRWSFVIGVSVMLIVLTSIPYIYGYFAAPEERVYSGIDYLAPGDTNTYVAMIEEVKQGNWSFHNLFTSEEHPAAYVNVLWLAVGILAKLFALSPLLAFHLARIVLIPIFVFFLVCVLEYVFKEQIGKIVIGVCAVLFASGLGIFVDGFLGNPPFSLQHPIDLWVTEGIPFLSVMHSPHFIASIILLLASLYWMMRSLLEQRYSFAIYAGCAAAVLFSTHPFYVPTVYAVTGVWALAYVARHRNFFIRTLISYLLFLLLSAPILLYFLWLNNLSIVFHEWSAANQLHSPNPWMYIVGFGFLLPFAVYGAIRTWKHESFRFLTLWVLVNAALLYVPFSFQRRLVEGLQIPLGLLAAVGVWALVARMRAKSWYGGVAVGIGLAIFMPLGNFQMISQDVFLYSNKDSMFYYMYYPRQSDIEAMRWLKDQTNYKDIILSSKEIGNFIPAYSGRRVFIGHRPQTLYYDLKLALTDSFFQNPNQRQNMLRDWGITYVMYSEQDKILHGYERPQADFLQPVFTADATIVYKVID